jgi:hypothetical protein
MIDYTKHRVYSGKKLIGYIMVQQDTDRRVPVKTKKDRAEFVIFLVLGILSLIACYLGYLGMWALGG